MYDQKSRKVLVIEDDKSTLKMITATLSSENYDVDSAGCVKEVFTKIKSFFPDLILMDIMLPDGDGTDLVEEFLKDPLVKDVPIVFISSIISRGESGDSSQIRIHGRYYKALGKPFSAQELIDCVSGLIGEA